jgi:hypothetical protein
MSTPLITLLQLRADMPRFATLSIGQDKIETLRTEHLALLAVASDLLGAAAPALTLEDLRSCSSEISARARLSQPDVFERAYSSVERLATAVREGATRDERQRLAADAARWFLALGRCV